MTPKLHQSDPQQGGGFEPATATNREPRPRPLGHGVSFPLGNRPPRGIVPQGNRPPGESFLGESPPGESFPRGIIPQGNHTPGESFPWGIISQGNHPLGNDSPDWASRQIGHLARTVAPHNLQPQGFQPDRPNSRQIGPARLAPSWRQIGKSARTGKSARLTPPERRQIDNSLPMSGVLACPNVLGAASQADHCQP